ncbi:MAG: hypothetical protein WDO69_23470 [Pseudomonadota bacterium]
MSSVYSLISGILRLLGDHDLETVKFAREHAAKNLAGDDLKRVSSVLEALERALSSGARAEDTDEQVGADPDLSNTDREFLAILLDRTFLPKRDHVVQLVRRTFGPDAPEIGEKDSRSRIGARALTVFKTLDKKRKEQVYRSLRRTYLSARGSSLADWSRIIAADNAD